MYHCDVFLIYHLFYQPKYYHSTYISVEGRCECSSMNLPRYNFLQLLAADSDQRCVKPFSWRNKLCVLGCPPRWLVRRSPCTEYLPYQVIKSFLWCRIRRERGGCAKIINMLLLASDEWLIGSLRPTFLSAGQSKSISLAPATSSWGKPVCAVFITLRNSHYTAIRYNFACF